MEVYVGPPEESSPVLFFDARGDLSEVTAAGTRTRLTGLTAVDADRQLLVAAHAGGILHLESARACTTISLPEEARMVAAAGATPPLDHLAVVVLSDDTWLLAWDEASGRIACHHVLPGCPKGVWLFGGGLGLLALRMPWGGHDRMLLWHLAPAPGSGGRLLPLPGVLVTADTPTGVRHLRHSPMVLGGDGTWLALEGDRWCETGEALADGAVPTRVLGSVPGFEPRVWAGEEASPITDEVGGRSARRVADEDHALPRRLEAP